MSDRLRAYLVTRAGHAPPVGLTGVGDAPLTALVEGAVAVWVSPAAAPHARDLDDIRRHNHIVVAATGPDLTPVPLRFGQIAGEAELRGALRDRADHWVRCLADFAGAAEFGLRVESRAGDQAQNMQAPGGQRSGRRFLQTLAARQRRSAEIAAAIHAGVDGLVRRERIEQPAGGMIAIVAHLVGSGETDDYQAALGRLADAHPECRFHSSGPWPPYSFAA